ncbi:hypothetical protein DL89DRAFT_294645 [Linderina pennispora]|uniref:Cytochrome b561 domain-containing protein n=1 Tax=Linderina pennispora TaxID=61395 RepID=A0A1Y1W1V6_9FUNG|nr:uncharacterized protein DL89DRAFT_294645 [Linderina pennispora]ORX67478.1 hypothetical protein DL89DRAFT_294645 [Linderina pennispora]
MAMCRIVSKAGNAGLAYHQILQTTVLASSTQAVIILQHSRWPAPPDSKRTARTAHIILQGVAGIACLAALVDGAMRAGDRGADQFWKAPHVRANIVTMAMFILQAVFGISMVFSTRLFGGQRKAKHSYKYHRICGYATLTAMWTTGALGVHAVLQQEGAQALNSRYEWHAVPRGTWVAAGAMLALGVVFGIDVRKIGLHRSAQVKKGTFARAWP